MGRKRKSLVEKSPFKLRRRKLADGRLSLFLDRCVDGGHSTVPATLPPARNLFYSEASERAHAPGSGRNPAGENRSPVECKSRDRTCRFRYGDAPFRLVADLL